ncbi:MAG: hypothetical protein FWH10_01770 [Oscillospiraceae bacterium]|nr:hypothetical protein [Oscillospiraceae bacterium]
MDTGVVFEKLGEFFPRAKKIESVTVLKEFTELEYKDDEMDVKFEFNSPHTVKMIYNGGKYVNIDDEEFGIYAANTSEEETILDYICYLDYFWVRYVEKEAVNIGKGLKKRIKIIKSKVRKVW